MPNLLDTVVLVATMGLTVVGIGLGALSAYLVFLTLMAIAAPKVRPAPGPGTRRFAVLVPAHNEEALVGRLLRSLSALDYDPEHVDVCVVADNCEDRTADIARSFGARVYERFTESDKAKGFALRWLL